MHVANSENMFNALRNHHGSASVAVAHTTDERTWADVTQNNIDSVIGGAAEALTKQGLSPADVADCSLADLRLLSPDQTPAALARLRAAARRRPAQLSDTAPADIAPPADVLPWSYFWAKIAQQPSTHIGSQRLALWYEVTLIMATLLFSIALAQALDPPLACTAHDLDGDRCQTLLVANQLVWAFTAIALWLGAALVWASHFIVIHLSEAEVRAFLAKNTRLASVGVLFTFLFGVQGLPFGIVLRVWITSPEPVVRVFTLACAGAAFLMLHIFSCLLLTTLLGASVRDHVKLMLGGFGLWPGTNRFLYKVDRGEGS